MTTRQKLALVMGCNYYGSNQLYGCVNDANNIKKFLLEKRGFDPSNVKTLYDKEVTTKNIWRELESLVSKSLAIEKLGQIPTIFLYYAGHGVLVPDKNGDEGGKQDAALVPWDFGKTGMIVDDELYKRFISKMAPTTEMFILPDCCYSGTNFDLEYKSITQRKDVDELKAKILQLSGAREDETSAEIAGYGVTTTAFIKLMGEVKAPYSIEKFQDDIGSLPIGGGRFQHPRVSHTNSAMRDISVFEWLLKDVGGRQLKNRALGKLSKKGGLLQALGRALGL